MKTVLLRSESMQNNVVITLRVMEFDSFADGIFKNGGRPPNAITRSVMSTKEKGRT